MAQSNDVRKSLQEILGGSKNLDPLEQTIFEKGPQAGFTPPEVQNVYQEGKTIFGQQPVTIDNSATMWYELGQNAFNIANKTFGDVVDYLIDSKSNAVRELTDSYQTKIALEYDRLQQEQNAYKASGDATTYVERTSGLLNNIKTYKQEWDTKVRKAIDSGQGSLFVPKIDFFDPNLDIKSLGLRYQDLAVLSRKAERDLASTITRTEWDAVSTGIFTQQKLEDRLAIKAGQVTAPNDFKGNLLFTGDQPIPVNNQNQPVMFMDKNDDGTVTPRKDNLGRPVIMQDDNGNWILNPSVDINSLVKTEEDADILFNLAQGIGDPENQSMVITKQGVLLPDSQKQFKVILSKPASEQQPGELYYFGRVFTSVSPDAVSANLDAMGLTTDQKNRALLITSVVASGGGMSALTNIRNIEPTSITAAMSAINSFSNPSIMNPNGIEIKDGLSPEDSVMFANIVIGELAKKSLGMTGKEGDAFVETIRTDIATENNRAYGIKDADPSDHRSIATFLAQHPDIRTAFMYAYASLYSNMPRNSDGTVNEEALKTFTQNYANHFMNAGNVIRFTPEVGMSVGIKNAGYGWVSSFLGGKDEEERVQNTRYAVNGIIGTTASLTAARDGNSRASYRDAQIESARGISKRVDADLFSTMVDQLRVVNTDVPGGVNLSEEIPSSMLLPLTVACTPSIWHEYGLTSKNPTMEQKIAVAKKILEDLPPVNEWDMGINPSQSWSSFTRSINGGIPIGLKSIPTKGDPNRNLLPFMVPISSQDPVTGMFTPVLSSGYPVLSIPALLEGDPRKEPTAKRMQEQRNAITSGKTSVKVSYTDDAPDSTRLPAEVAIRSAQFASASEVIKAMPYTQNMAFTTTDEGVDFIKTHADIIIAAAEADKSMSAILPILRSEFGLGGKKTLFTDANLEQTIQIAKSKGAKTMEDLVSYIIGTTRQYAANIPSRNNTRHALPPMDSMGGVPTHSTDFLVQGGEYAGMVLKTEADPDYFNNIRAAAFLGNNVYKEPRTGRLYVGTADGANKIADANEMTLLFAGKQTDESDEAYNRRFEAQWSGQINRVKYKEQVKDAVRSFISDDYYSFTHPEKDSTVLPSAKVAQFNSQFDGFRDSLGVDAKNASPQLVSAFRNYDWKNYWLVNRSFPSDLSIVQLQDSGEYIFKEIDPSFIATKKKSNLEDAYALQEIRKTMDLPFDQQKINNMLRFLYPSGDNVSEEDTNINSTLRSKLKEFREAGWTPAQFEYQLRVAATKKNSSDLIAVAFDMKPTEFSMDSSLIGMLNQDFDRIFKDIGPNKKKRISKVKERLLNEPSFAIDFKKKYAIACLYPASRRQDANKSVRMQLLEELLK